ncbi:MAG: carbonic anhydrase [Candidatus Kapabacteria bacterium]|nr:carbonic anhydrase [Candidatus Kapabacteria bacterium]
MKKINKVLNYKLLVFIIFTLSLSTSYSQSIRVPKANLLNKLKVGNHNFVKNDLAKFDFLEQREVLSKGQHPETIIVTCSDSRVAPEYIYNTGLGELFVIRVAGNVVDDVALGSIEYAVEHLKAKQIVVMGHSACGAVTASLKGETESPYINSIIKIIKPAATEAKEKCHSDSEALMYAIKQNVINQIKIMHKSKIISEALESGEISIWGAIYNIASGQVEFIESNEQPDKQKGDSHD